jgi:hypothetical protein
LEIVRRMVAPFRHSSQVTHFNKFAHEMNPRHLFLITVRLAPRLENPVQGMIEGTSKVTQLHRMIGLYPTATVAAAELPLVLKS